MNINQTIQHYNLNNSRHFYSIQYLQIKVPQYRNKSDLLAVMEWFFVHSCITATTNHCVCVKKIIIKISP